MNATELTRIWKELEIIADEEHASYALESLTLMDAMELNEDEIRSWLRDNRTAMDRDMFREHQDEARMESAYVD